MNIDKYLKSDRTVIDIANDIKYRKLQRDDIKTLVQDKRIRACFFGGEITGKKPRSEWDREYLNTVSYAPVAECFNEEFLFYLDEVADHVVKLEQRKKRFKIGAVVAVVIAIAVTGIIVGCNTRKNEKTEETSYAAESYYQC